MPSADQVPTKSSHSTMLWHKWFFLIAGSTGSALRAVRPPNLHITPVVRRDLVYAASAMGSLYRSPLATHGPDHSRDLIGERDGGDLRRPPCQQCCEPGPMFGAMDLGIAYDGQRDSHEQAAQISVN